MFNKRNLINEVELTPGRLEALTDGIVAIAMTLLVLEIHVPELVNQLSSQELWAGIAGLWPKILSFFISFIILGMFWVSHHTEFKFIKKLDNKLIWLNIFFLLFVSLFPFSAALLGSHTHNQAAVIIYGLHLIFMVLMQYFISHHAYRNKRLTVENFDPRINHLVNRVASVAIFAYLVAIALSFINPNFALIFYSVVPIPYIFGWIYYLA